QNVPLEVAVDQLAVHEPDYKNLIAFLKAMGFKTLTQRVADKIGIDAAAIAAAAAEPAAQPVAGRQGQLPLLAPEAARMPAGGASPDRGLARQHVRSQPIRNHHNACATQKVDRARARDRHLGAEERNREPG